MAQPANSLSSDKWSSLLSRLNPIPSFPEYTGPYKVGTADVEIPVSELDSPAPAPDNAADIETVQFRMFYPAHPDAQGKRITWLPAPQRDHLSAYIQFLGVGQLVAQAVSFLPRHLHYTYIPVVKNAPILEPNTPNNRWPTVIFSHGLGGSRNAYSQIVGSLASHGVVVICPEHRDGSAVKSFIRIPSQQNRYFVRNTRREVPYRRIPHDPNDETHALRNDQLRIRLWEMGLVHEALLGIDRGSALTNLNKSTPSLAQFVGQLHVQEPGSIIFAGHSFGSATMVQFLKSVFYAGRPELEAMTDPLYVPSRDSSIYRQVTPRNVTILMDMWCFPLLSKTTKPLWDLPLPAYASPTSPPSSPSPSPSPGGTALLAVSSEDFHNWKEHLHVTARALSPSPSAPSVLASAFYSSGVKLAEPHFFFVERSAHLSQSDFGVLFPWLMFKIYKSEEPDRALRLNRRALLQVLRVNGVPVARTWTGDLVDGVAEGKMGVGEESGIDGKGGVVGVVVEGGDGGSDDGVSDDRAIFDRGGNGVVDAWRWIDIVGMGDAEAAVESVGAKDDVLETGDQAAEAREPEMAGVIEPHVTEGAAVESR
ncbi:PAF acetylhydrolase [Annulohypoxylon maeteangense]|uniref:PAF acetylhydrolase n=1 Tax=Annulohypoxylon maeteangense TaxID=1927788 RepID=UPI002008CC56|nr:PAF acetylhydrolase [Annulohypoxylon maeteangense]KAI0881091.1 PAF acetylhydrolase [Annulohypoxylon maeteangense]